jgi:hypothetical protein
VVQINTGEPFVEVGEDYLTKERLLSPETIERYGITMTDGRVRIPAGTTARIYYPNGDPKIKWERAFAEGESMPLFGFLSKDSERPVLVAEGEFDAALASEMLPEYDVVSGTGGAGTWLPDWSSQLAGRSVTQLYDADDAGSHGTMVAAPLNMRAGATVKIARWPDAARKGYDITDHFKEGKSADELRAILTFAPEYIPPLVLSKRASDFAAQDIDPQSWLVEGVWPDEGIGVVFGQPEVFKSFFVLDMAFAVALGGVFLGQFDVPRARRVMVIQMESSAKAFQDRLNKIGARFGGVPDNLYVVTGKPILLEDKKWGERLLNEIAVVQPGLIILDPLASMTAADENSAQEMGVIVRALRGWRDQFKTSVCIVHHEVKNTTGVGAQNIRGSSALHGAVEVAIRIERPDPDAPKVSVKFAKFKEAERPRPFFAEFNGDRFEFTVLTDERMLSTSQQIREFLAARGEASTADVASALNLKPHQARDILRTTRGIRLKAGTGQGNKPAIWFMEKSSATPRIGVQGATPDAVGIAQTAWTGEDETPI